MTAFTLRFDLKAFLASGIDELCIVPEISSSSSSAPSVTPARYAGIDDGALADEMTPPSDAPLYEGQPGRYAGVPADDEEKFDEASGGQTVGTSPAQEEPVPAQTEAPKKRGRPKKMAEEIIAGVEAKVQAQEPIQIDIEEAIATSQQEDFSVYTKEKLQHLMMHHIIHKLKNPAPVVELQKAIGHPSYKEMPPEKAPELARAFFTAFPDAARSV